MMRSLPHPYYHSLPNSRQTLLLKACLLENDLAIEHCRSWLQFNTESDAVPRKSSGLLPQIFDRLDFGSQRLLPLLYRKMKSTDLRDPFIEELKGYYRYTWVRNQLLRTQLASVVGLFSDEKIRHVIIKGFPVLEFFYKDLGTRPILDLDIAVFPEDWLKAVRVLKANQWIDKSSHFKPELINNTLHHAIPLVKGQCEIDLHLKFLHAPISEDVEKDFWAGVQPYQPLHYMLRPEHQLICAFAHGYHAGDEGSMRAIADAAYIIQNYSLDWNKLICNARSAQLIIPCTVFLEYIKEESLVEIPDQVIKQLTSSKLSRNQLDYFKLVSTPAPRNLLEELRIKFYRASMLRLSFVKRINVIINTYKFLLGIESLFGLGLRFIWVFLDRTVSFYRKDRVR